MFQLKENHCVKCVSSESALAAAQCIHECVSLNRKIGNVIMFVHDMFCLADSFSFLLGSARPRLD